MIEREYDISGAIVFWSLQPTPYQALLEALEAKGYAEPLLRYRAIAGCVGDEAALEFQTWEQSLDLPDPDEGITPAKLDLPRNKTPEEYFALLLEQAEQEEEQRKQQQQQQQADTGNEQAPQTGEDEEAQDDQGEEQGQGVGQGGEDAEDPAEIGGSAADGQPRPWEDGPPSAENPGLAEHEQNIVEAAVAKAIEQYQQQRGCGSVPGGLARQAADLLHPKVDPAKELLAKVQYAVGCTSGFGDFTYRKFNRRQPAGGALLPAHVQPIPRVTVIVDTSGSMEKTDLATALGVIANALRSLPDPRGLRVLAGDTAVACAKNVFRPEQIELSGSPWHVLLVEELELIVSRNVSAALKDELSEQHMPERLIMVATSNDASGLDEALLQAN
ncbi:MAG: hypothetical protein ABSG68_00860 [Thermoguttaceae bacterium]|jgi:hypothetical protein